MPNNWLLAIPVFNEETYLLRVLDQVRGRCPQVLVIDDGSTDSTPDLLREVPDIHVITHLENRGYGKSLADAFCFAQRHDFSWLITMDCDEQHEPARIGAFLDAADENNADIISGTRYPRGWDRVESAPADRREINRHITEMLNRRLGLRLTDAFCGFKAYRVPRLSAFEITVPGYAMPMQFWVQAARANLRIRELPVPLIYNDPTRHFGGLLDDPNVRLQHYIEVMERELREPATTFDETRPRPDPSVWACSAMLDYQQLAAPDQHGGVLVVPDPKSCAKLARENSARLDSSNANIQGSTLGSLRAATRARLPLSANQPVIVVGHQPDFFHPGVWAKTVVASRMSRALQGVAINLVVDSDSPKRLALRIPVTQENRLAVREVRVGTLRPGCAYEQLQAFTAPEIENLKREISGLLGDRFADSLMPIFLDGLAESPSTDWVSQVTEGRRRIEAQFGIELQDLRIRDTCWSPLAAHLLLDAGGFARAYNESIAEYRVQNKVRSPNRPIPDLVVEGNRIELPFWLYFADRPRCRAFVTEDQEHVTLCAQNDPIVTISRKQIESCDDIVAHVRKESGWMLRPRALITTIWARLFLADLFIHGIGGAKYDRISDLIIARYFQLSAPEIACVTATLYMDPNCGMSEHHSTHEHQLRDATWNPQRHVLSPTSPELGLLIKQRQAAARRSDDLASISPEDRAGRRAAFQQIRRLNAEIHGLDRQLLDGARIQLEQSRREAADRRIACDRDYFFALHSRTSLEQLLNSLPDSSDFV